MKRLVCVLLGLMLAFGGVCNALALELLTVEVEDFAYDEETMYLSFIGLCAINGIAIGENSHIPSIITDGDSLVVRFSPLANTFFDFNFEEKYTRSVSLTLNTDDAYVLSNASTLNLLFVMLFSYFAYSDDAEDIALMSYLIDNLRSDAVNTDFTDFEIISEYFTFIHTPPYITLLIYLRG